jgi:predicted Zn-dependent protease
MAGLSLNIEKQLKNSRLHESEADHIGIQFLSKAGYNPHSMGDFFARLAKENRNNARQTPEILRSHPVTERRIVESENRAQTLSIQSPKLPNNKLTLIQLKLSSHAKTPRVPSSPQKQTNAVNCYQQNLQSLTKQSEQASANIDCLQTLVQQNPNHLLYTTLFLQALIKHQISASKQINMALHQATYLLDLYPNNTALLLGYTDLLLYLNQPSKSIALLTTHTEQQRYTYQAYKKLSEIYAKQQQTAEAHFFLALAQFDIGNLKRTLYLLQQAKITASNSLKQRIALFEHKNSNLLKTKKISKH